MESDKIVVVFIPVSKGMMHQMKAFYGDVLRFTISESKFAINNIATVRAQLQYSEVKIDPAKNPIFQFNIIKDFPEYCISLRQQGVRFDFAAMTPGGYMAKLFDPCNNAILIECESFESSSDVGI